MTKPARKEPVRNDGPTKERRSKGDVGHNDLPRSVRIYSVATPLDRLLRTGGIEKAHHQAGKRYAEHCHHAGLTGTPKSADLNAVGGGSDCTYGMAANEFQANHRLEYRNACRIIGKWRSAAFEDIVVHDTPLEDTGYTMGQTNKKQAIAAAREMLLGKLEALAVHWGYKT